MEKFIKALKKLDMSYNSSSIKYNNHIFTDMTLEEKS